VPQTIDYPASGAVAATAPAWQCVAGGLLFLASLALCVLGYLAFAAPGPWLDAPPILQWSAREFSVTRGSAQQTEAGLVVTAPDATRSVVIALNTSFRARDYPVIAWDAANVPQGVVATLLWYSDIHASRMFRRPVAIEGGHLTPVSVSGDPGWLAHIRGLALVLQGDFKQPIVVRGAAAKPMSAAQVLGDCAREWFGFEPWTGASINGLKRASEARELPLPAMLAGAAALATLGYAGLWRWRLRSLGVTPEVGLAAVIVAAWIVADGGWEWNLLRQGAATWERYGGKSWQERHLAAEDGPLFGFINRVRTKLPPAPARVFIAADLLYFRARAAYHLYPYNAYYDPASPAIPPPGVVRSGDYLVAYRRQGVQYDAAERRLRWDGYPAVEAELLLAEPGAALFQIR